MNKHLYIFALLLLAVVTSMTSCKNEVEEIFEQDAITRLEESVDYYTQVLTNNGADSTKWQLEYFSNSEEPGYIYVVTFYNNGSVRMSGMNKWVGTVNGGALGTVGYGSAVSLWDVIADNGPVLSFNSYNKYFHIFAEPEDIPDLTDEDTDETGYGHEGDYEFDLMKYSNDTLYLTGKKYTIDMIMTRIDNKIDDEVYMNEVNAMADSFFNAKIPHVYIVLPNQSRWIVEDGATSILTLYQENADKITTQEQHNVIITHDGLSFMTPVTLEGYTIQNFNRKADGSLLCRDDQTTVMRADELSTVFTNTSLSWRLDLNDQGGNFASLMSSIASELTAYNKSSLVYVQLAYNKNMSCYNLTFNVKKGSNKYNPTYYCTITASGDEQVKFAFESEGDKAGALYAEKCPSIQKFIDAFNGKTFDMSANSLLAPVNMKLSSGSDYTIWNIQ